MQYLFCIYLQELFPQDLGEKNRQIKQICLNYLNSD